MLVAPDITFKTTPKNTKEGNWECREGPGRSDWDFYAALPTLTKKGVEYIQSRKGKAEPFFLYFPLPSPHAPSCRPMPSTANRRPGPTATTWCRPTTPAASCSRPCATRAWTQNTIVFFSADNGAEQYAYARDEKHGHWSSGPLRGLKRDIYEGGHRVPEAVLKWHGLTKPGAVTDALFSQIDLIATFAAFTGFALPDNAAEDSPTSCPGCAARQKKPAPACPQHK